MPSDTAIECVEAFALTVPLAQPIDLGTCTVAARDYVAIRIHLAGGLVGEVVSLTRKMPVDILVLDLLGPQLIGIDALNLADCDARLNRCTLGMEKLGVLARALSLLDIALHDARAKLLGQPLWLLLGGRSSPVEVLLVEGYRLADEPIGAMADRLLARTEQGYRRLKIEIGSYDEPKKLIELLDRFRRQSHESRIVLDALWRWRSADDAARFLAPLRDFDIGWVEDPFPPELSGCYRRFRDFDIVPAAAGDDMTNPDRLEDLMDGGATVMRLDVTTIGGIQVFHELAHRARRKGISVSPHFYPQIHQHLAFGWGMLDHVEVIPSDRSFDQTHALVENDAFRNVKDGLLYPPADAGAGYRLDMPAVGRWSRRRGEVR